MFLRGVPLIIVVSVLSLLAASLGEAGEEGEQGLFTLEGVLSIPSPGEDYQWRKAKTGEATGIKSCLLECAKPGEDAEMTLLVELRTADGHAQRLAAVKSHYSLFTGRLQKAGITELKKTRPALKAPIPDRVEYRATGRRADGSPVEARGTTVFGKNTYAFVATAATRREADQLLQVSQSLKELNSTQPSQSPGQTPPQARPVASLLQAIQAKDPDRLKTVFSVNLRKEMELQGLDSVLKVYQGVFEAQLGKYRLEDFRFEFQGNDDEGKVAATLKGKRLPAIRVVREEDGWKIDER